MNTDNILNVFEQFRMPATAIDQYNETGKAILADKIQGFVSRGKPIEFSMLGYPFKSMNNRDKVLGTLPDLGEQLSIENFGRFNAQIQQVYSPGVQLHLISDGLVFNDLMDVPESTVDQYREVVMDMSAGLPISWYQARDFYPGKSDATMRQKVMDQFGITAEKLERDILFDPDVNFLYRGMIKFMTGDLAIRDFVSNSQLHKAAKKMAREMMFRNEAYSALVRSEFSDKIRLSMHPSVNNGVKYSFQLIPSERAWTSPWHCAILTDTEGIATVHRKDAEEKGYRIEYKNNRPYNFTSL